jgi:hypothetical protein
VEHEPETASVIFRCVCDVNVREVGGEYLTEDNLLISGFHPVKLNVLQTAIIILLIICGLVVRVPGYISRGPGSIPGTNRFIEK